MNGQRPPSKYSAGQRVSSRFQGEDGIIVRRDWSTTFGQHTYLIRRLAAAARSTGASNSGAGTEVWICESDLAPGPLKEPEAATRPVTTTGPTGPEERKMGLSFSDGEKFDVTGEPRVIKRSDGYYVVGDGMLIPATSAEDGNDIVREISEKKAAPPPKGNG